MPINPNVTIQSAMTAMGSGKFDKAESLYLALASDHPGLLDTHMLGGVIAATQGNRAAAIERFRKALIIDGRNPAAHNWLSVMLRETGQNAAALEHAQTASKLRRGDPQAMCNLGLCLFDAGNYLQAVEVFQQAVAAQPGDALFHAGLGKCYEAVGRDLDALREFQTAAKLAPDYVGLLKLGELLSTLGRFEEAITAYGQAIELKPESARAHVMMSRTLSDLLRHEEAKSFLDKAEQLDPRLSDVYVRRAYVLQMLGRFPEADLEFEKAIELNKGEGDAYYGMVSARKITESDRPLLARIEQALLLPDLRPDDQAYLHYCLGKALDNLGEFGRAMAEYDEANRITWDASLRSRPFDPTRLVDDIDSRIAVFTKEFFESTPAGSNSDCPIFIVGMPRSGTTLVEQILSCHSQVAAAGELSFWVHAERRVVSLSKRSVAKEALKDIVREYLELIKQLSNGKSNVTDKNPANCLVLGAIHAAFPNARIIHTRRDPIDTALSIYMTPMRTPPDFACDKANIVFFTQQYRRLMSHWRETLPKNRYLEIDYEDLVADGGESARRLIDYCGLDWEEACLHPEDNPRAVRTPSFWQVRQPLYTSSIQRWKKYEHWLGTFEELHDLQ